MTINLRSRVFLAVLVPSFVLALSSSALAQEQGGFAKVGGYVGFSGLPKFTLDGETFDGQSAYKEVGGEEMFILPKLDKQNMFRAILGFRGKDAAIELSYDRTRHSGTFFDFGGEAVFQSVNLNGRFFFLKKNRIQPHLLFGGSFPWLRVIDGSWLGDDVGDARYRGYGINSEAGVTVYPHRSFGVAIGYGHRVMWFDRASGATDRFGELRPKFRETSGSMVITGLYTF